MAEKIQAPQAITVPKPTIITDLQQYINDRSRPNLTLNLGYQKYIKVDREIAEFKGKISLRRMHVHGDIHVVQGLIARFYGLFYIGNGSYSTHNPVQTDLLCSLYDYAEYLAELEDQVERHHATQFQDEIVEASNWVMTAMIPETGYPDDVDKLVRHVFRFSCLPRLEPTRARLHKLIHDHFLQFSGGYPRCSHNGEKFFLLINDLPGLMKDIIYIFGDYAEAFANENGRTTKARADIDGLDY
jgi:hypothetical protein